MHEKRPEDEERENHGDPRAAEDDGCAVTQRNPFKRLSLKIGWVLKESSLLGILCPKYVVYRWPLICQLERSMGLWTNTQMCFWKGVQGGGVDVECTKHTIFPNGNEYNCYQQCLKKERRERASTVQSFLLRPRDRFKDCKKQEGPHSSRYHHPPPGQASQSATKVHQKLKREGFRNS